MAGEAALAEKRVLILGSAPNVIECQSWPRSEFSAIVAINNAWRVRDDWDYHIAPDDFPPDRGPQILGTGQSRINSKEYVPANNRFGGVAYAGGTMAFSAGYWALSALAPSVMIFVGCDMVYPAQGKTHFYGAGTADPLREDVTLRNLEAKSARLMFHAARQGCLCMRAPSAKSRLAFPVVDPDELAIPGVASFQPDPVEFQRAQRSEDDLGYFVESGRYWEKSDSFSVESVDAIDQIWMNALRAQKDLPGQSLLDESVSRLLP